MQAERTVDRRWLKLLWIPLAFAPLLVILMPLTTRFLIAILCYVYLSPSFLLASLFQVDLLTRAHGALTVVYCILVGLLLSAILADVFRLPKRVPLERVRGVMLKTWLPVLSLLVVLGSDYKGVFTVGGDCPGRINVVGEFCSDVARFRSKNLGGYIDTKHVARFEAPPEVFDQIILTNELARIDSASVPDDFWRQPPWWWNVQRGNGITVYRSADFPLEGRGADGDHFLLFRDADTNMVYTLLDAKYLPPIL